MNILADTLAARPNSQCDVVGLGTIVVDLLMVLDAYPTPDTKNSVKDRLVQVGGPVPTALAALSRLGHRCHFSGNWGDDPLGTVIESDLAEQDIGFGDSQRISAGQTGLAHVWIDGRNGQRTIAYARGNCLPRPDAIRQLELLRNCQILHLDGWPEEAAVTAATIVRDAGGLVSVDAGSQRPGMRELLEMAHIINCPRKFLREHLGHDDIAAGLDALSTGETRLVTITDGSHGAHMWCDGERFHQPAFQVTAVDTNGAGDAFCGGLLGAVLQRLSPQDMLRFASAVAAIKCTGMGNRRSLPTLQAVQEFLGRSRPC